MSLKGISIDQLTFEAGRHAPHRFGDIRNAYGAVRQSEMAFPAAAERGAWKRHDMRLLEQRPGKRRRIGAAVDAHEPEERAVGRCPAQPRHGPDAVEQRRAAFQKTLVKRFGICLLYTSPSPRDS